MRLAKRPRWAILVHIIKTQKNYTIEQPVIFTSFSITMAKTTVPKKAAKSSSSAKHSKPSAEGEKVNISKAQQNVLNWAAKITIEEENPEVPRDDIVLEVGITKGSLANHLTKLKNEKLLDIFPKHVVVTEKGMALADTDGITSNSPQTHEEQREKLMSKYKLSKAERELIEQLSDGSWQNREDVRKELGSKSKGSFANILTKPKKHKLLEIDGKNLRLTDIMFVKKLGGRPCEG